MTAEEKAAQTAAHERVTEVAGVTETPRVTGAASVFAPAFDKASGSLLLKAPAVIVPLIGTTAQMLVEEAQVAEAAGADVAEWRIDFMLGSHEHFSFAPLGKEVLEPILAATKIPLLLTIRSAQQGGETKLSPMRYRLLLAEMLDTLVHVDADIRRIALDLEHWFDGTEALARRAQELGVTVIVSHHDWQKTPSSDDMHLMFLEMLEMPGVVAKLAVTAQADDDVQRLLEVTERVARDTGRAIIAISMGERGKRSRLEGWRYGSVATFAAVKHSSAPGQPSIEELREALA